jgi:hypothetical protein
MSFLSTIGKDFKAVFSWLGSSSGQAVVAACEGLVEGVATVVGVGAPVQSGINLINSWLKKIITTETIAAAAAQQTGSGTQKAAAVLTAIGPELNMYFPGTTTAQATIINNALVIVLNTLGAVTASTTTTTAAPATGAAVPGK